MYPLEDDQFMSNPSEAQSLALTMPPITELMGMNYGELVQEDIYFVVSVLNAESQEEIKGGWRKTSLNPRKDKTPLLADVVPNQVYRG
jgi:hypothetical protein